MSEPRDTAAEPAGPVPPTRTEERLGLLARAARAILYETDLERGRIAWVEGKEALTGYPSLPSDTIQDWFGLMHPDDVQRVGDGFRSAVDSGASSCALEYRVRHRDGHYLHVLDRTVVVRDGAGRPLRAVGCTFDVSAYQRGEEELHRSRAELRALAARLQSAREREMGRIARDLHDDLGQALTGLQLDLRWVEQQLEALLPADERSGPVLDRLVAASELAQATLHTVQRIALDLRPASLDQLGLAGALRQEARRFTQRTGLPVEHRLELECSPAYDVAVALYRICQEALTNVARHARASRVAVRLREEEGALLLEVEDDGCGLPADSGAPRSTMGILGMEERAASMGGWLRLGRGTLGGTLVVARIPAGQEGAAG